MDFLETLVDNAVQRIANLSCRTFLDDHIMCAEVTVVLDDTSAELTFDLMWIGVEAIAHLMYFNESVHARNEMKLILHSQAEMLFDNDWEDMTEKEHAFLQLLTINGPDQFDEARQLVIG